MSAVFYIKQGDTLPSIEVTLKRPNGNPIDLTNATVLFKMDGGLSSPATVVGDPTEGVVRYDWTAGDTDNAGKFKAEFEIEWADGRKQTVPNRTWISVYITDDVS